MTSVLPLIGVGFVLGFRHAFEPDHLAAITTLASRQGTVRDAARLGVAWGAGHTAAVAGVALAVIALDLRLPAAVSRGAELLVAALLVALGLAVFARLARRHRLELGSAHAHAHAHGIPHLHAPPIRDARRSLGFGVAHGLAGSGAVMVLLVASASTRVAQFTYLAAFGAGTVLGMLGVSGLVVVLARAAGTRGPVWSRGLQLGTAAASVAVGVMLAIETSLGG